MCLTRRHFAQQTLPPSTWGFLRLALGIPAQRLRCTKSSYQNGSDTAWGTRDRNGELRKAARRLSERLLLLRWVLTNWRSGGGIQTLLLGGGSLSERHQKCTQLCNHCIKMLGNCSHPLAGEKCAPLRGPRTCKRLREPYRGRRGEHRAPSFESPPNRLREVNSLERKRLRNEVKVVEVLQPAIGDTAGDQRFKL
jgi:hypothetical protein